MMLNNSFGSSDSLPSSQNCFKFSKKQVESVIIIKMGGSTVALIICFVAMVIALKDYRKFVYRLVIYLLTAVLAVSLGLILDTAPVYYDSESQQSAVRNGTETLCVIAAFFSQNAQWTEHLIVVWIIVYILLLVVWNFNANKRRHELSGIAIAVLLPFTFNWVPFLKGMYGFSGLWCWIKLTQYNCETNYSYGLALQFGLFFGPMVPLLLFSLASFAIISIVLYKRAYRSREGHSPPLEQAIKEALRLLIYPFLYNILWSILIANCILYTISVKEGKKPNPALWITSAIAEPLRVLLPPLAFLLHPQTIKKLFCKKNITVALQTETAYTISPENSYSEEEPLVIRGNSIYHSQANTASNYPLF